MTYKQIDTIRQARILLLNYWKTTTDSYDKMKTDEVMNELDVIIREQTIRRQDLDYLLREKK